MSEREDISVDDLAAALDKFGDACKELCVALSDALAPAVAVLADAVQQWHRWWTGTDSDRTADVVELLGVAESDIRCIDVELGVVKLWNHRVLDLPPRVLVTARVGTRTS
jgi:hypothetical protein